MRRVLIASGLWALVMTALGFDRYATYHAGADMGLFTQTLASAFAPTAAFWNTLEGGNHFTYHFSPILYLFAPFVIAAQSGWPLIVIQAVAGALVAPPLYRIARRRLDERTSFVVALCALFYPPLVGVTFTDFHEAGLLPAATVWLLDALDTRAYRRALAFAFVCLMTRDDQGLILGFLGALAAVFFARRGERGGIGFGAALVAMSACVFVGYFAFVRPLAGGTDGWHPLHFYNWDHSQGLDVRGRLTYLLEAFGPLAFVPFAAPVVILALPGFAEVLGSHESLTYTMGQHYPGVWVGFVLFAFVFGLARAAKKSTVRASRFAIASLVISLLWLAVASPTHWGHFLRPRNADDAALDRVVSLVKHPPEGSELASILRATRVGDGSVGTFDELYAHLGTVRCAQIGLDVRAPYCRGILQAANRRYSFFGSDGESASPRSADVAIFDAAYASATMRSLYAPLVNELVAVGQYEPFCSDRGVRVFVRQSRPDRLPRSMPDFPPEPTPDEAPGAVSNGPPERRGIPLFTTYGDVLNRGTAKACP